MTGCLALIFRNSLELRVKLSKEMKHSQLLVFQGKGDQFPINHDKNKTKNPKAII